MQLAKGHSDCMLAVLRDTYAALTAKDQQRECVWGLCVCVCARARVCVCVCVRVRVCVSLCVFV